jgi:hypothetical protein
MEAVVLRRLVSAVAVGSLGLAGAVVGCTAFTGTDKDPPNEAGGGDGPQNNNDAPTTPIVDGNVPSDVNVALPDGGCVATLCASRACSSGGCDPLVFVTSARFRATEIQSLANADSLCEKAAAAVGRASTYRAWLSISETGSVSPNARFVKSTRPYRRMDKAAIADSYTDLVDGMIQLKETLSISELSQSVTSLVWTGTTATGDPFPACLDWTSDAPSSKSLGSTTKTSADWSLDTSIVNYQSCGAQFPIYCFEQLP